MDGYHTTHEWDSDVSLSHTVIDAIATARGIDPAELDPLHSVVDIEALDRLFESPRDSTRTDGVERVEFAFGGHRITATSSGDITVRRHRTRDELTDEEAFQDALAELIQEAEANGVDVEGGWACRDGSDPSEWGIEIYEVRRTNRSV